VTADRQLPVILALGKPQMLAWGSSYYLPTILADPIARDLGISSNWFFAAFSASLGDDFPSACLLPGIRQSPSSSPRAHTALEDKEKLAHPTRFERVTFAFGGQRSIYAAKRRIALSTNPKNRMLRIPAAKLRC
jgi:hypothetical protein